MNIVVTKQFKDSSTNEVVAVGQPLKVSADRAKKLVEYGFAKYAEEAPKKK